MTRLLHFAETDPDLQDAYKILCAARGFQVETSGNAVDCLQRIQASPPRAVIVDVEIPWGGGDGLAACLRQFERDSLAPTPPVFVTGNEEPQELSRRTGVRQEHCFQKPFRIGSLLDTIGRALRETLSGAPAGV